tara:strand:- start:4523 stop:5239 length:717 start_codon:yes stop_codon:yes gene_type:complete
MDSQMNTKWKSHLTAEEAALFAVGLECYESIPLARASIAVQEENFQHSRYSRDDIEDGIVDPQKEADELDRMSSQVNEAGAIWHALLDEIPLADPRYPPLDESVTTHLAIATRAQYCEDEDWIVPERCTLTKLGLSRWFWQHDREMARKFWPSINDEMAHPAQPETRPATDIEKPLSPKTENTYLRLISALSDALINGLTGTKNKDAEAVLMLFDSKPAGRPVDVKTLAKYLEKAEEL